MPPLAGNTVAIIGYGNHGRAQAACLRESGVRVIIGSRKGKSFSAAKKARFPVYSISEAVRRADVLFLLIPDLAQQGVFSAAIAPNLRRGHVLLFAHGFSVCFGLIKPPPFVDVVLLAPKATGPALREAYRGGAGVPAAYAVHRNASGRAKQTVLALARALKIRNPVRCTFAQEACANLFAEQAVTIGGLLGVILAGFETMVSRGVPPELAYIECVGVSRLIANMLARDGLKATIYGISDAAGYGALTRGGRVVTPAVKREMRKIFGEIESGAFARELLAENASGMARLYPLKREASRHPLEAAGRAVRAHTSKH